jgi:hypothetical protein
MKLRYFISQRPLTSRVSECRVTHAAQFAGGQTPMGLEKGGGELEVSEHSIF